jgi:hypothetical protein
MNARRTRAWHSVVVGAVTILVGLCCWPITFQSLAYPRCRSLAQGLSHSCWAFTDSWQLAKTMAPASGALTSADQCMSRISWRITGRSYLCAKVCCSGNWTDFLPVAHQFAEMCDAC